MKAPVDKLVPTLRAEAEAVRERIAAAEFAPCSIRELCFEAARAGQMSCRKRLPNCGDLRRTKAVELLVTWCKGQGLVLSWESRMADLPDGSRVEVWEPEISWRERR